MKGMELVGQHLTIDARGCPEHLLDDAKFIRESLIAAVEIGGGTLLNIFIHQFNPQGVTACAVLAESHIALHTWPELGYFAADLFFCGAGDPARALDSLCKALTPERVRISKLERGTNATESSLKGDIVEFNVKKVLHNGKTRFQHVVIADTEECGQVLTLDGATQSSRKDEYIYHESLVQPAMMTHDDPRTVLIIGGGEGATLREVLIHPSVERAVMVDLDQELVALCRTHLPEWGQGYLDDPRVKIFYEDGGKFITRCKERFDIIVIDLVDALDGGPATKLYTKSFYARVQERLNPGGLLVVQAMQVSGADDPKKSDHLTVRKRLEKLFPLVRSYLVYVPCFWAEWAFLMASTGPDPSALTREQIEERLAQQDPSGSLSLQSRMRFYDADAHFRMFTLTKDVRRLLGEASASVSI